MNKKCKLPITFLLWDRLITSDNNLRQFYTIFLYHWTILPEDSSFFFTLPAILAHLYNWTSGNFPVMQQVPMLTVEQARRQHGSVWRTYRVLCVLLIWSCNNIIVASYHSPPLGMFCKRDVCILALYQC